MPSSVASSFPLRRRRSDETNAIRKSAPPAMMRPKFAVVESSTTSTATSMSCSSLHDAASLVMAPPQEQPPRSILKIKTQEESLAAESMEAQLPARRRRGCRKRVYFTEVQFMLFPLCLGDNPSVRDGLPLALDYSALPQCHVEGLETYERRRRPSSLRSSSGNTGSKTFKPRRTLEELRLSKQARRERLDPLEYKHWELRRCAQRVRLQQSQREWTKQ
ncbi:expressed unknown protein (Partial), partial [Seminavis robusta]|eukprot:Sro1967_g308380.1 n/a (218) ;mRNA; f:19554-20208